MGAVPSLAKSDPTFKRTQLAKQIKLTAAGKLISAGRQMMALSLGAGAIYTARGFMLALGCIQSLRCNNNTCPVGITTHADKLQHGLDIEDKSQRVKNYALNLHHYQRELMAAMGKTCLSDLNEDNLIFPG